METTKLYYEDAYLREFDAAVLSCREEQGRYLVVLDRTAFYPEGGGQPADHGVLGGVAVTDVQERNGVVYHTCTGSLAVGSTVHGILDWQRRFDHMQQHSGEHILSGLLCSLYHCDNVGFHLGADTVTIDYNAELTWEQVMAAEKAANEVIWQDTPVDITFPAPDALGAADLLGDDHPAQFINAADDSGCFHAVFPPCFRFCLQFGCVHSICQPREFIPAMHGVKIPPGAPRFSLPLHCVLGGLLLQ